MWPSVAVGEPFPPGGRLMRPSEPLATIKLSNSPLATAGGSVRDTARDKRLRRASSRSKSLLAWPRSRTSSCMQLINRSRAAISVGTGSIGRRLEAADSTVGFLINSRSRTLENRPEKDSEKIKSPACFAVPT